MTTPSARQLARTSLYGGLLAGALDIAAAVLTNPQVPARAVFQSVATGVMGRAAYGGGWNTAALGLALHFGLMLVFAAVYVVLAVRLPVVRRQWIAAGVVYGLIVWSVMNLMVVPLSASTLPPPDIGSVKVLKAIAIHVFMVGLPLAWIARKALGVPARG